MLNDNMLKCTTTLKFWKSNQVSKHLKVLKMIDLDLNVCVNQKWVKISNI